MLQASDNLMLHTPAFDSLFKAAVLRQAILNRVHGVGGLGATAVSTTSALVSVTGAAIGAGASIAGAATLGAIAGPIGAIAGALVGIFSQMFQGCGSTCTLASNEANQVENLLQQNLSAYEASGHTQSEQAAAIANAQYAFTQLNQFCSNPQLGAAGQRCISERLVQGGTAPWCPNPGHTGCDWITTYLLPIQNDPNVVPDTPTSPVVSSTVNSVLSGQTPVTTASGTITGTANPLSSLLSGNGLFILIAVGALLLAEA
jgi:hypothetical protein